jgi:hypothetical protein
MKTRLHIVAIALIAACADSGQRTVAASGSDARLRWELIWATDETTTSDARRTIVNDLDYTVVLEEAWVVSYSAQLLPCSETAAAPVSELRRLARGAIAAIAPVRPAWAGHGDSSDTTTAPGTAENLVSADEIVQPDRAVAEVEYCRAHYLVARADTEVANVSSDELSRNSLVLHGTWNAADGASGRVDVVSSLASGVYLDLPVPIDVDGPWTVTVSRDLGRLFDGIDFAAASENDIERAVLTSLVDHASVSVSHR